MDLRLPIPKNWQDFENICHRLWLDIWNDPNTQKNGRQGQNQNGVDIFGIPIYSKVFSGIQCKDKNNTLGSFLKTNELHEECIKANGFIPNLSSFTIATTASRDSNIQTIAREITTDKKFPFSVHVWSWDDIESEIIFRPNIFNKFYPDLINIAEYNGSSIILNRFSSMDNFQAFFSRPTIKNIIEGNLKDYIISLAYELSDNAYKYGKATEFKIAINEKTILFSDNGKKFNPIMELNSQKTNSESHVGSYVFNQLLKEFNNLITCSYNRKIEVNKETNELIINLSEGIDDISNIDYLELNVNWLQAAGRDSAYSLANSILISKEIKEIVWNVTESYALSFFIEYIRIILFKLDKNQKLTLFLPRKNLYKDIHSWFNNDERLIIKTR